jgi:hypothetical protein
MRIIYTESVSEKCHPVRILNYNENGIYFENLHHIPPCTVLVFYSRGVEFPEHVTDKNLTNFKSMDRAEVKWCKDLKVGNTRILELEPNTFKIFKMSPQVLLSSGLKKFIFKDQR